MAVGAAKTGMLRLPGGRRAARRVVRRGASFLLWWSTRCSSARAESRSSAATTSPAPTASCSPRPGHHPQPARSRPAHRPQVTDLEAMEEAARELAGLGPSLVIVKGGRRRDAEAVDVAFDGHSVTLLRAPWVDTPERARHRMHLLGRHRRQPRPRSRAARGCHFGQGVRHQGDPGQLAAGISGPATGLSTRLGAGSGALRTA